MNFGPFSFHPLVLRGIKAAGYETPTPIQAASIPKAMDGRDLIGLAQTGTGKTAAFVLPILHRLVSAPKRGVRALVVAPTRELAEQIHGTITSLARSTGLNSAVAYGGVGITPQIKAIKRAAIVVGCPGRLLDHLTRGTLDLSRMEMLVLDEADHMFDMGFLPDIRRILSHIPSSRQTLLFSATMPEAIRTLAKEILSDPETVRIGTIAPARTVRHALFPVAVHLKTALLIKLLGQTHRGSVLVFTRTKHRAKSLGLKLSRAGYRSASLQGNLSQARRQAAMEGFRSGEFDVLVATDIAARGIDVNGVSHVINYDVPTTTDAYIHRIGRTGRAAHRGEAFTLVTEDDTPMVNAISRAIGSPVERRTLTDFDYQAPAVGSPKRAGGQRSRSAAAPGASRAPVNKTRRSRPRRSNFREQTAENGANAGVSRKRRPSRAHPV